MFTRRSYFRMLFIFVFVFNLFRHGRAFWNDARASGVYLPMFDLEPIGFAGLSNPGSPAG